MAIVLGCLNEASQTHFRGLSCSLIPGSHQTRPNERKNEISRLESRLLNELKRGSPILKSFFRCGKQ